MFDLADQIRLHDDVDKGGSAAHESICLINKNGRPITGAALSEAASQSLVFLSSIRFLFWVPGVSALFRWGVRP